MGTPEPLWRVMRDAYGSCAAHEGTRAAIAAELRAIADWLDGMWAAQQPPAEIPMEFVKGLSMGMEIHREGTLNILRAEADRAEARE